MFVHFQIRRLVINKLDHRKFPWIPVCRDQILIGIFVICEFCSVPHKFLPVRYAIFPRAENFAICAAISTFAFVFWITAFNTIKMVFNMVFQALLRFHFSMELLPFVITLFTTSGITSHPPRSTTSVPFSPTKPRTAFLP